jgi:ferritin
MINERLQKAINTHINKEIYSAYLYASMAAYFDSVNLPGFSNWMRIQVQEELAHAVKFWDFISNRGGRVILTAIDGPPSEWPNPLAVFEEVYAHEQTVSKGINELMDLAIEEHDHMAKEFLQWFIAEQVEEEASVDEVVQRLKLVDKTEGGLFLLDQEMDKRTFVPLPELAGAF